MTNKEQSEQIQSDMKHEKKFIDLLVGRTIAKVQYLTQKEADDMGWDSRPLVIWFTDGSHIVPQSDDEGNNGGAMFYAYPKDGYNFQSTIIYTL